MGRALHIALPTLQNALTMNLLIIDDEPTLRRTLRTALEVMGHAVSEANTGPAALDLLGKQRFDLAFLDLRWAARRAWTCCRRSFGLVPAWW